MRKSRKHLSRRVSKRLFSRTAQRTHKKNLGATISRGGIRL